MIHIWFEIMNRKQSDPDASVKGFAVDAEVMLESI